MEADLNLLNADFELKEAEKKLETNPADESKLDIQVATLNLKLKYANIKFESAKERVGRAKEAIKRAVECANHVHARYFEREPAPVMSAAASSNKGSCVHRRTRAAARAYCL